jgi:hypothetical protein
MDVYKNLMVNIYISVQTEDINIERNMITGSLLKVM